ncbi:S9 family peptidase [Antarcticibacterium flavum]|uniref:S9 family peptidase n=1 Tax=Antarcticibacterium flavum TaxID=2058175 RepID=A0A5B7X1X3_9FLAO|nr:MULTISPECIES: S9 family peptidase [Antarcticibacterium]MCM4159145.1 S9 family peptidase [Antarcticibacterium sp. W02-3]QCY69544.1 S9 family peptidase [Antarcticibacterium flavum]
MKYIFFITAFILSSASIMAQEVMTPEKLWELGRVSALGISKDGKSVVYRVTTPSIAENDFSSKNYTVGLQGGEQKEVENHKELIKDKNVSPDGEYILYHEEVKVNKALGEDYYPEMEDSEVYIYDALDYRHWDTYNEGKFNHVFYRENKEGAEGIDIMKDEPHHSPQKPFGGDEDYIWSPDGKKILYVSKKLTGTEYANSTNTDIYEYDLNSRQTRNLTDDYPGYDKYPAFSSKGDLAWLQMGRDGFDIIVRHNGEDKNLTANWDGTVNSFKWSPDGSKIYFVAPVGGTVQLMEVNFPGNRKATPEVKEVAKGDFDITGIVGFSGNKVILTRTDFNHAAEIYSLDLKTKKWEQLTNVNASIYDNISKSKVEKRWVPTTDGKEMLVWVIFPPDFDASKKYPTLLYLQGGPQGALSQFYSFRWNFQVMAAQGYIVVAPNRRGMPGHGVAWNEDISKDWGGQAMDDYLSAIDALSEEPYVDNSRIGAVGASFGGYSAFYLAGIHENRFKTFISHAGLFNLQSMYGTTEELFFVNWDIGGPYWDTENKEAQHSYASFNPITNVSKWDTPMLIIQGEKDFRVPVGQSQEAFQVLQQKGIKSRFILFPEENHWILKPQNAMVWQREFFRWLEETL